MTIEIPTSHLIRVEAQKAAADNGFRIEFGEAQGWLGYKSTTAPCRIWIAAPASRSTWHLSLDHEGVAFELGDLPRSDLAGPGVATFVCVSLASLHRALDRVYKLATSLPNAPFARFEAKTKDLPRSTEIERLVVQRIGQDVFRDALMDYWGSSCPVTGITDPALLRASHIVAWADCECDAQQLDVYNGLLLSALWDAAFDCGLVSFADDGTALAGTKLSATARAALGFDCERRISGLRAEHRINLSKHRKLYGY